MGTRFEKGRTKTGGRQPGAVNKLNADVRDAIFNAFEKVGGQDYLVKVANEHPQVFCTLLGKILPKQVDMSVSADPIRDLMDGLKFQTIRPKDLPAPTKKPCKATS